MNKPIPIKNYYDLLQDVLNNGARDESRTGVDCLSVFGRQLRFDLSEGFPLLPGKFTPFRLIAAELLWFLSGSTNNEDLRKLNGNDRATIWEEWQQNGELGPIYGHQWRKWKHLVVSESDEECNALKLGGYETEARIDTGKGWGQFDYLMVRNIDQIAELIDGLIHKPLSRRHIVSAWNVADLPDEPLSPQENVKNGKMALAPCHALFQFDVRRLSLSERMAYAVRNMMEVSILTCSYDDLTKYKVPEYGLSCRLDQRSADMFLGAPFNIASYALLTHMVAHVTNMVPEDFIWQAGNCHIYSNHIDQVRELLSRDHSKHPLCTLKIKRIINDIDDFKMDDFEVVDYTSYPAIKAEVAI